MSSDSYLRNHLLYINKLNYGIIIESNLISIFTDIVENQS